MAMYNNQNYVHCVWPAHSFCNSPNNHNYPHELPWPAKNAPQARVPLDMPCGGPSGVGSHLSAEPSLTETLWLETSCHNTHIFGVHVNCVVGEQPLDRVQVPGLRARPQSLNTRVIQTPLSINRARVVWSHIVSGRTASRRVHCAAGESEATRTAIAGSCLWVCGPEARLYTFCISYRITGNILLLGRPQGPHTLLCASFTVVLQSKPG